MNLINSFWFLIAVVINVPVTLWMINWLNPIAALFAGLGTTANYIFQITMFTFVFMFLFIIPTIVLFGSVGNSPVGQYVKKGKK